MNVSKEEYDRMIANLKGNSNKTIDLFNEEKADILSILKDRLIKKKAIFLKGNVPSLKNSKEIQQMYTGKSACCNEPYLKLGNRQYRCTKCNNPTQLGTRPKLGNSKVVDAYIENHSKQYAEQRELFLEITKDYKLPHYIGMYFLRDSNRRFDFNNATGIITDLMVDFGWIEDDNVNFCIPVFLGFHKNEEKPGVVITPIDTELYTNTLIQIL